MTRKDGRTNDQLRPVTIERGWSAHAEGSALVTFGGTKVLCTASFTNGRAALVDRQGQGLVTAELRDAAARDEQPQRPRVDQGQGRRSHARDLAF